jgi:hypothetical protein
MQEDLAEETWPAHADNRRLSSMPLYTSHKPAEEASLKEMLLEGKAWTSQFYAGADRITQARQEHVHPRGVDGQRKPLSACHRLNVEEC